MIDINVTIGIYLIMLFINSIIAGLFLYIVPLSDNASARISIRYYLLYFLFVALGFSSYVARAFIDFDVSVFLNNLFFISAAYCVLFGSYWRFNVQRHLYRHVALIHITIFPVIQTLLSSYNADYIIIRLVFSYANISLVYFYAIYVYNKLSQEHNQPAILINIGVVTAVLCFLAVPVVYYVSSDPSVFASMLLLMQNVVTMVLFGCIFSSFMFEIIQRYKTISVIDDLTGLYNRRSFMQQTSKLLKAAQRHHFPICVAICDLDFFKSVNDKYGHLVGDLALQECAKSLTANTRENDVVARFGGEEFIILMPQTDLSGAKVITNRMCECIAGLQLKADKQEIQITASFGLASLTQHKNLESALKSADNAMYFAKENGRNQVRSEDEFMQPNESI